MKQGALDEVDRLRLLPSRNLRDVAVECESRLHSGAGLKLAICRHRNGKMKNAEALYLEHQLVSFIEDGTLTVRNHAGNGDQQHEIRSSRPCGAQRSNAGRFGRSRRGQDGRNVLRDPGPRSLLAMGRKPSGVVSGSMKIGPVKEMGTLYFERSCGDQNALTWSAPNAAA